MSDQSYYHKKMSKILCLSWRVTLNQQNPPFPLHLRLTALNVVQLKQVPAVFLKCAQWIAVWYHEMMVEMTNSDYLYHFNLCV